MGELAWAREELTSIPKNYEEERKKLLLNSVWVKWYLNQYTELYFHVN